MADVVLTRAEAEARVLRRADYVSCPTAFIDCKKPGSHLKQNYSMIGPGVTTSTEQVVNIREPHGFNIGAAAMPQGITNNLHIHFTAEVFMVFGGSYLFRWGNNGDDGEILGEDGDIVSVPTWIFRGFSNVGPAEAMVFTTLGGDDTGGLIWHPAILAEAGQYGLYLTKDNILVDTATGAQRPPHDQLIEPISEAEIATLRRYSVADMRQRVVKAGERAWSSAALLDSCLPGHASELAPVIGFGISQDRDHAAPITNPHGFSHEWLRLAPGQSVSRFRIAEKQVLLAHTGAFTVTFNAPGEQVSLPLEAWGMVSVPADAWRSIRNESDTTAEILVITHGDGRKIPEWPEETVAAARAHGRATDASGMIAPAHLLPRYLIGEQSVAARKDTP
jgi:quercetin dioxygenase-like cupin family protein